MKEKIGAKTRAEGGFSLIELMVAMVVTLVVTGAIYGLVATGQSAFRREPELTDRQQNTRLAMATIEQDIVAAGTGLPPWMQVFTPGLDNVGLNGEDELEIIVGTTQCPPVYVCQRLADTGSEMVLESPIDLPQCFPAGLGPIGFGAAVFSIGSTFPNQAVVGPMARTSIGGVCAAAASADGVRYTLNYATAPVEWKTWAGVPPAPNLPVSLIPVQVVRYRVATDPNDPMFPGDPNFRHLWRSTTGGRSAGAGNWGDASAAPAAPVWQLVARGIQDMQVQYVDGSSLPPANAPLDSPQPVVLAGDWSVIVRQVNVTLSSRVASRNLVGYSGADPDDPTQLRLGQLSSQFNPRAALTALQQATDPLLDNLQWK